MATFGARLLPTSSFIRWLWTRKFWNIPGHAYHCPSHHWEFAKYPSWQSPKHDIVLCHSLSGQIPVMAHVFGPLSYTAVLSSSIQSSILSGHTAFPPSIISQTVSHLFHLLILYLPTYFSADAIPHICSSTNISKDSWFSFISFHFSLKPAHSWLQFIGAPLENVAHFPISQNLTTTVFWASPQHESISWIYLLGQVYLKVFCFWITFLLISSVCFISFMEFGFISSSFVSFLAMDIFSHHDYHLTHSSSPKASTSIPSSSKHSGSPQI